MNDDTFLNILRDRFPNQVSEPEGAAGLRFAHVTPDAIIDVLRMVCDDASMAFRHLTFISGIDRSDAIELAYGLLSYVHKAFLLLKVTLPRDNPVVSTVTACSEAPTGTNVRPMTSSA